MPTRLASVALLLLIPAGIMSATRLAYGAPLVAERTPKLDPNVTRVLETGIIGAFHGAQGTPGRAKVLIELSHAATPAMLATLEAAGATLSRTRGKILFYDRFVPAELSTTTVARVTALPEIVRISSAADRGPLPLDRSAQLVRLADARGAHPELGGLTGKGILIADVDSMVDPFHPTFFKGDGGYYDWIDVDKNGSFTPGVDAIDLDGDKLAGAGEIGLVLSAATVDERHEPVAGRPAGFDPSIDWVFLDTNGNKQRDYGKAGGFDDTAPALGEPLFTPDDVNKNGKLDVGERFVRLGTSKFKKIWVNIRNPGLTNDLFERGINLAETKVDYTAGALYGFADALHATGVNTILVGDLPLVGRRWVGIAPEADVVVAWDTSGNLPLDGLSWALGESPDVMLHELAPWTGLPLDGTDPMSAIIDGSAAQDNITHTCPTGDQGSARKHAGAKLPAGASASLPLQIPGSTRFGTSRLKYVDISVHVRGGAPEAITITGPKGDAHTVLTNGNGPLMSGAKFYATTQTTSRGTSFTDVVLYAPDNAAPLDVGTWTVLVTGSSTKSLTIDAYVSDDISSWALGAAWDSAVANDHATLGVPSVADHCIAVNAQPDHLEIAGAPWFHFFYEVYDVPNGYTDRDGQIRAYTPRGPRIDGVIKPDVTAPDNPWAATEHLPSSKAPYGAFRVFGGTSGASPHVTGVAALLAQAGVQGDAARDAIRMGAIVDATTGTVPNADYGFGRLSAAGALGIKTVGKDFTVTLTTDPSSPHVGGDVQLIATASGDADATMGLTAEWDDGYDGTWDIAYTELAPHPISALLPSSTPYKVRVRNASGRVAEAVLWVTFTEAPSCGCRVGGASPAPARNAAALVLCGLLLIFWRRRCSSRT